MAFDALKCGHNVLILESKIS